MLLAVDTSTRWIGLALYDESQVLGEFIWQTHNFHTVELTPALEQLLERCKATPKDLQALAVALGPGSFTSLRIGLAAVKGMALGLKIPIIGIPSLDIVAFSQPVKEIPLIAVLQAGRGRLACTRYTAVHGKWKQQDEIRVVNAEELASEISQATIICGELSAEERQIISRKWKKALLCSPAQSIRRPSNLAEIAWQRWKNNDVDDPASLAPIYLHLNGGSEP